MYRQWTHRYVGLDEEGRGSIGESAQRVECINIAAAKRDETRASPAFAMAHDQVRYEWICFARAVEIPKCERYTVHWWTMEVQGQASVLFRYL